MGSAVTTLGSALLAASKRGDADAVKDLLQRGADVNYHDSVRSSGKGVVRQKVFGLVGDPACLPCALRPQTTA
jgi:hypothetical protein